MKIISKDKKQKIKSVHHSIKTQMITSFVGLLICLVVTLMFINGKFLEPYYISKKESRFIELYEKLNDVSNEDKWDSTKKNNSLIHFAEKNNISYLVIEKDNDVHTNVQSDDGIFSESGTKRKPDTGFYGCLSDQPVMGSVESELLC